MLAVFLVVILTLSGCITNTSPSDPDTSTAAHSIGDGTADFWTSYPSWHPKSGQNIEHPQWVIDVLKEKPLIILAHSTNCLPCIRQQSDLEDVMKTHGEDITYIDMLTDGSDARAWDVYDVYYPQSGQWYIPLTVILSQTYHGGTSQIIWHSAVGATGKEWLEAYIEDAITYYG